MSKTKFTKVAVSERLPEETGYYFTDEGISYFVKGCNEWSLETLRNSPILEWLEESPDREDEMREMLENLRTEIRRFESESKNSAEQFELSEMPNSSMCSKAMARAYNTCSNKIDSLLQSLKQEK